MVVMKMFRSMSLQEINSELNGAFTGQLGKVTPGRRVVFGEHYQLVLRELKQITVRPLDNIRNPREEMSSREILEALVREGPTSSFCFADSPRHNKAAAGPSSLRQLCHEEVCLAAR